MPRPNPSRIKIFIPKAFEFTHLHFRQGCLECCFAQRDVDRYESTKTAKTATQANQTVMKTAKTATQEFTTQRAGHVRKVTLEKNDRAAVLAQTISPLNYQQNLAALSLRTMLLFPVIDKLQMPPNSSQNLPKSVPKSSQIDPKGLLEPIWDRWLKKN